MNVTAPPWLIDLLAGISAWDFILWCAGIIALIIFAVKLAPKIVNTFRQLSHFLDDWAGEDARPGQDRRPGVMERLKNIEHEITPNHGGSMNDALRRVERSQIEHRAENEDKFSRINKRLDELAEVDDQLREDLDNTINPTEGQ